VETKNNGWNSVNEKFKKLAGFSFLSSLLSGVFLFSVSSESFELRVNYSNLPLCGENFKEEWE